MTSVTVIVMLYIKTLHEPYTKILILTDIPTCEKSIQGGVSKHPSPQSPGLKEKQVEMMGNYFNY